MQKPASKIKVTVRIGGKEYTIVSADTAEHVRRIASYVDRKLEEMTFASRLPEPMVMVLTAMNLAEDLMRAQDENTRLRRELLEAQMAAGETQP